MFEGPAKVGKKSKAKNANQRARLETIAIENRDLALEQIGRTPGR